jgi:hypothetical protein
MIETMQSYYRSFQNVRFEGNEQRPKDLVGATARSIVGVAQGSGGAIVTMMKPADFGKCDDLAGRSRLDRARGWTILVE